MAYNISSHEPLEPESTQTGIAQLYTFVDLPKSSEEPPKEPNGNYRRKPKDFIWWSKYVGYVRPSSVKLMLPFGPEIMR